MIKKILLNHWTVLIAIFFGGIFGAFFSSWAKELSFIGVLYMDLLQVAIIPIMLSAVVCSFCNIFRSQDAMFYLKRLLFISILIGIATLILTLVVSFIINPGAHLSKEHLQLLSKAMISAEHSIKDLPKSTAQSITPMSFIDGLIPTNIIHSIYNRNDTAVVVFSIILGISLGVTKSSSVTTALSFFDAIFCAFLKYVNALIYLLPFALFFLIGNFIASVGIKTLYSLFDLIFADYIILFIGFITLSSLISWKGKKSFFSGMQELKGAYLIAFSTSSSFAAMPAAMLALQEDFRLKKQNIELLLPLGVSLFKPGMIVRCIIVAVFLMNLYHVPFTVNSILILILTSIICSIAATAGPAILSVTMFSMVLSPLGIPPVIGIFLLLSVEPILDPVTTVFNIQSNVAITLLVSEDKDVAVS